MFRNRLDMVSLFPGCQSCPKVWFAFADVINLLPIGFAAFLFVVAFLVFLSSAIMVSPLCCGSGKERGFLKMQKNYAEQSATLPAAGMRQQT